MEWQPIETAPKDGTICHLRLRDPLGSFEITQEYFLHDDGMWYRVEPPLQLSVRPTHWRRAP